MSESSKPWTAGRLRKALECVPDDTVIVVNTDHPDYPDIAVEEHTIHDAGYGEIDWGDGYGLEPDQLFGLLCRQADFDLRTKPDRVRPRKPENETEPQTEPEIGD